MRVFSLSLPCWGAALIVLLSCQGTADTNASTDLTDTTVATATAEVAEAARQPPNIVNYFQQLKEPYNPGFTLQQAGNVWKSASPSTGEALSATVDLKNGFIEIQDPGTGGGEITYRVVLFRLADGQAVLGITNTFFDGLAAQQTYYFVRPDHAEQYDWTEHTLPVITGFDFLPPDNAEEPDIVERLLPVLIDLPRHGTTATARVDTSLKAVHCGQHADTELTPYCGLFNQLQRTSIPLRWNRTSGQFEMRVD